MWKRVGQVLFSTKLMAVLLLIFAVAMAVGTFIENDHGTPAAKAVIYQARWFEALMLLLAINFIGNISRYKLWRKEKWPVLAFHVGFLVILLGAAITRFISYEGIMRIREGSSSDILITDQSYLRLYVESEGTYAYQEKATRFSPLSSQRVTLSADAGSGDIEVSTVRFIPSAVEQIVPGDGDQQILNIVVAGNSGRQDIPLISGDEIDIGGTKIAFNKPIEHGVAIRSRDGELTVVSSLPLDYMVMADQRTGSIGADSTATLEMRTLYRSGAMSFVIQALHENARLDWVTTQDKELADQLDDVLLVDVEFDNEVERLTLKGGQGYVSLPARLELGDNRVDVAYGPKPIQLPFSLGLTDFQLERYPGSQSPSAYASEVVIMDGGTETPYRIFMNNVLDHRGYRFFQASYDTDERGTVLSVNHDFWGTSITYLGYLIMGLGMMWTLFGRNSYFRSLSKRLDRIKAQKSALTSLFILMSLGAFCADASPTPDEIVQRLEANMIEPDHAAEFGELLVQDLDGRIKPINSLSSEFIRKITRKPYYQYEYAGGEIRMTSDQALLSIISDPISWQHIPIIYVHARKGAGIAALIGIEKGEKASFADFP